MDILKRILAIMLGVTVLPFFAAMYGIGRAVILLFFGIEFIGRTLITAVSLFNNSGMSKLLNVLLSTFFILPLLTVITTLIIAYVTVVYLFQDTIFQMIASAWIGFKSGLLYGLDGFWDAFTTQSLAVEEPYVDFRRWFAEEEFTDTDFEGFQLIHGELEDVVVVREDLDVPDLQSKEPQKSISLLTDREMQQIAALIAQAVPSKEPLPPGIKEKFNTLDKLFMQYKNLSEKLKKAHSALVNNDKSQIDDELIPYNDVETPILLVKQYKKQDYWYNVPACSYITDKESLLNWLKTKPINPVNRDSLKKPEPYNQMETKYIWYELTVDDCSSQELGEAAVQMRVLFGELGNQLLAHGKNIGERASSPFFFGTSSQRNPTPSLEVQDEVHSVGHTKV